MPGILGERTSYLGELGVHSGERGPSYFIDPDQTERVQASRRIVSVSGGSDNREVTAQEVTI